MKFSKKLIVSSLASVMAVSLVGAITGTVAWYQYNTRVTTSLIGMNVAETGVLDISATSATAGFTRDLSTSDLTNDKTLTPITWATGANQTATSAFPALPVAYKNPNASLNRPAVNAGHASGNYSDVFQAATAADYIQYTVYLRGRTVNDVSGGLQLTAEAVYLSDFVLAGIDGFDINGLRIHLACYDDSASASPDRCHLISNTARENLPLYGKLDCDADGVADRVGGYEWETDRDETVTYGEGTWKQTTKAPAAVINAPDGNGVITANAGKLIVTTPTTADHASKIVVTIWMEGWDTFDTDDVKVLQTVTPAADTSVADGTYFTNRAGTNAATGTADGSTVYYHNAGNETVPMWSGEDTDGGQFKLGMTFAVSSNAFLD